MKFKSALMKKGLFLIIILVIASVSAIAADMSGLADDNEASVTFKLVGVGPNRPPGWPDLYMENLTYYVYTLDGKPYNTTVPNPPEINWSDLPFPPIEERERSERIQFDRNWPNNVINFTIYDADGNIIMTWSRNQNQSSSSVDPALPPGEYSYDVSVPLPRDVKDYDTLFFDLTATGTGEYIFHFRMTFINPHNKWNHLVGWLHRIGTDSTAELKTGDIEREHRIWSHTPLVVSREMSVYYRYVDFMFTVTQTGSVKFYLENHCIITDINGDGKVDIKDVFLLSKAYGTHLDNGINDANYQCDMDCDLWIDFEDLHLLMLDFGETIPP